MEHLGPTTSQPPKNRSGASVASLIVDANGPRRLFGITGDQANAAARWVQLHDSATLPADTAVPALSFRVPATSSFHLDFGAYGRYFKTGIVIALSTTGPTLTIAAAEMTVDARYI